MTETTSKTRNPMTFERLMHLGQVTHAQGDSRSAHNYWQQAAMLEPENEQVWTALMWVLDDEDDRKVCLKNILTINPKNIQAQQMLDDLIGETQPRIQNKDSVIVADVDPDAPQDIYFLRIIVLGTILGFGTALSIILLQMLFA